MKLPKFNLRDLFWLVVVVAMGLGWWQESRRYKMDRESLFKLWAFDIAARVLVERTGDVLTVGPEGVSITSKDGVRETVTFGELRKSGAATSNR